MSDAVMKEVGEFMDDFLEIGSEESSEAVEDKAVEEEPKDDQIEEPTPESDEVIKEEEPKDETVPVKEAEEASEEEPEEIDKDAEIERLRAAVEERHTPQEDPVVEGTAEDTTPEPEPIDIGDVDFIGDIELDPDSDTFKADLANVLKAVYAKAYQDSVNLSQERVLMQIPKLVLNYGQRQSAIKEIVTEFYSNNQDLEGYKRTVAAAANEVHAENPDLPLPKIFEMAAEKTRKTLGLKKKAIKKDEETPVVEDKKKKKAPFAKPSGRRDEPSDNLKGMAKEIDDMLNLE